MNLKKILMNLIILVVIVIIITLIILGFKSKTTYDDVQDYSLNSQAPNPFSGTFKLDESEVNQVKAPEPIPKT